MKRIGFSASEEMSFENVDGLTMDTCIYYKLTYEPLAQGSAELKWEHLANQSIKCPRVHFYNQTEVLFFKPASKNLF